MGMVAPVYYTADQVRALPDDGKRYEVVRGELLVTPAPRLWHQELVRRLLVLSPSSTRADGFTKRLEYQRERVPTYWIVDSDERRVEVWAPDDTVPHVERDRLIWYPAGAARPFALDLAELFRPI